MKRTLVVFTTLLTATFGFSSFARAKPISWQPITTDRHLFYDQNNVIPYKDTFRIHLYNNISNKDFNVEIGCTKNVFIVYTANAKSDVMKLNPNTVGSELYRRYCLSNYAREIDKQNQLRMMRDRWRIIYGVSQPAR